MTQEEMEKEINDIKIKVFDVIALMDDLKGNFAKLEQLRQDHLNRLAYLKQEIAKAKEPKP